MTTITIATVRMSNAAARNVEESGVDVAADLAALRSGQTTEDALLDECLDGADDDRAEGWREYVAAVVAAAKVTTLTTDIGHDQIDALTSMAREHGKRAASADIDGGSEERGLRAGPFGDGGWIFSDVLREMLGETGYGDATEADAELTAALRARFSRAYDEAVETEIAGRDAVAARDD